MSFIPGQAQAQPGVSVNPYGYSSRPLTAQYIDPHSLGLTWAALASIASSSKKGTKSRGKRRARNDDGIVGTVVTYDEYMENDNYTKGVLGFTEQDIENLGVPQGILYEECDLLIPLPPANVICTESYNYLQNVMGVDGGDIEEIRKKTRDYASRIATEYYRRCKANPTVGVCNKFNMSDPERPHIWGASGTGSRRPFSGNGDDPPPPYNDIDGAGGDQSG